MIIFLFWTTVRFTLTQYLLFHLSPLSLDSDGNITVMIFGQTHWFWVIRCISLFFLVVWTSGAALTWILVGWARYKSKVSRCAAFIYLSLSSKALKKITTELHYGKGRNQQFWNLILETKNQEILASAASILTFLLVCLCKIPLRKQTHK